VSYQVTAWVGARKAGSASGKAVLFAIANYAQAHGETYQPIAQLAEDTEQSKDAVRRRLLDLEERGLIARCARWAESGRRLSDWIIVLYCDEAHEFARAHGWTGPKSAADRGGRNENDGADDFENASSGAAESACLPSQIARVTLADCEGHPGTGARVTLALAPPPNKENSKITVKDSLSPDGEADGCAVREREIIYEKTKPLSDDELDDWKKFHDRWRWQPTESEIVARGVFRRLGAADRAAALRHVRAYVDERAGKAQAYAGNWLKQRGWEPYVEREAKAAQAKARLHYDQLERYGGIIVRQGTRQAAAWAQFLGERLKFGRVGPFFDAVLKPTEWPPAHDEHDPAHAPRDGPGEAETRV